MESEKLKRQELENKVRILENADIKNQTELESIRSKSEGLEKVVEELGFRVESNQKMQCETIKRTFQKMELDLKKEKPEEKTFLEKMNKEQMKKSDEEICNTLEGENALAFKEVESEGGFRGVWGNNLKKGEVQMEEHKKFVDERRKSKEELGVFSPDTKGRSVGNINITLSRMGPNFERSGS